MLCPISLIYGCHNEIERMRFSRDRQAEGLASFRNHARLIQMGFRILSTMLVLATFSTDALWKALGLNVTGTEGFAHVYDLQFSVLLAPVYGACLRPCAAAWNGAGGPVRSRESSDPRRDGENAA